MLHRLWLCAGYLGGVNEADGYFRHAFAIREKALGVDTQDVAGTLCELGLCSRKVRPKGGARAAFCKLLQSERRSLAQFTQM